MTGSPSPRTGRGQRSLAACRLAKLGRGAIGPQARDAKGAARPFPSYGQGRVKNATQVFATLSPSGARERRDND